METYNLQTLGLPSTATTDEINGAIVAAAIAAVETPLSCPISLTNLYSVVSNTDIASSLDVLDLLSILLPSNDLASRDLIAVMGECGSAKEVVMATDEEMERLVGHIENEEEEDDDDDDDDEEKEKEKEIGRDRAKWSDRLVVLINLYRTAIPRLALRRKSASETLKLCVENVRRSITAISSSASVNDDERKTLLESVGEMVRAVNGWVKDLPGIEEVEMKRCQSLLKFLLDSALVLFGSSLKLETAGKALNVCFPRLRGRKQELSTESQSLSLNIYETIYTELGYPLEELEELPSLSSIILLARSWLRSPTNVKTNVLVHFLPIISSSLQANSPILDDTLAFLLLSFHGYKNAKLELSPEVANELLPNLIHISISHPLPEIRHQVFRTLSLALGLSPSQLRFQVLTELVGHCEFENMRVAAIGLLKDAVLEALSTSTAFEANNNVFGSKMFMRVFGPLLFRPQPPDLFDDGNGNGSKDKDIKNILGSSEPKRIIDVLGLYYVLLVRDEKDLTGVKEKDMVVSVKKNLLDPLRSWVNRNTSALGGSDSHFGHEATSFISIEMALSRVDEALEKLSG